MTFRQPSTFNLPLVKSQAIFRITMSVETVQNSTAKPCNISSARRSRTNDVKRCTVMLKMSRAIRSNDVMLTCAVITSQVNKDLPWNCSWWRENNELTADDDRHTVWPAVNNRWLLTIRRPNGIYNNAVEHCINRLTCRIGTAVCSTRAVDWNCKTGHWRTDMGSWR